jgi:hypothetical protein
MEMGGKVNRPNFVSPRLMNLRASKESASISVSDFLNGDAQDTSQSTNPFNLRPSPQTFVMTLQEIKRPDITSEIFVRLLNSYIEFGGENENGDSLR